MPLVEVRRAIYTYTPADGDELALNEGDVLYIVDNDDPDWLQAKKKQLNFDDPKEQGLVPANHTEPVESISRAKALYAYEPVEDEETALEEGEDVLIVENDDPDWYMAKTKSGYGFIPKAYVDMVSSDSLGLLSADTSSENPPAEIDNNNNEITTEQHPSSPQPAFAPPKLPAVAASAAVPATTALLPPPPPPPLPTQQARAEQQIPRQPSFPDDFNANGDTRQASTNTVPAIPPPPPLPSVLPTSQQKLSPPAQSPQPFQPAQPSQSSQPTNTVSHFNVTEGKKKKGNKVTLGISNLTFIVDSRNDAVPPKQYPMSDVSKCTVKKSVLGVEIGGYTPAAFDFTCSSNAEAESIMDAINAARRGTFVGSNVMDAVEDVPPPLPPKDNVPAMQRITDAAPPAPSITPSFNIHPLTPQTISAQEYALVIYDFSSDDPEELTVSDGDRVLVLDKSDPEWWQVQLSPPHGRAGLVPAAYVELQAETAQNDALPSLPPPPPLPLAIEQEDVAATPPLPIRTDTVRKAASRAHIAGQEQDTPPSLPQTPRQPANAASYASPVTRQKTTDSDNVPLHVLQRRQANTAVAAAPTTAPSALAGPNMGKVRTWTDGSGAYTVEAEFIDMDSQGNVQLHKTNGKMISVSLSKFSAADRDYVNAVTDKAPEPPEKPKTARQRQLESARKTPGKRIINYDWDWFDFFTLKADISADNALKYATSFVAERLDDQSIPEITTDTMHMLGVKPDDITRIEHAFRVHQGSLPADTTTSQLDALFSSPVPAQTQARPLTQNISRSQVVDQAPRSRPVAKLPEASTEMQQPSAPVANNNPWGMDSELDRRVGRKKQIEEDEALARKLQQEESSQKKRGVKSLFHKHHHNEHKSSKPDPFTSLDGPSKPSSSHQRSGSYTANGKQPLNLAAGTRKANRSQISVVDPSQLRSAQQRLESPTSPIASTSLIHAAKSPNRVTAFDEAFGVDSRSPHSTNFQQKQVQDQPAQEAPPRARPATRQQQNQTANMASLVSAPDLLITNPTSPQATVSGLGELTTNRMAAATASGNTAQINMLEQMAKAKEQELAAQEARIRQQQEEIRKQTMFLQQQQQQLLQMQQTQKVETQLKQLREENERLEKQRQTDELKKQVELLKSQQEQMLKMQQMASQARGAIAMGTSAQQQFSQQQQPLANLSGMATPMSAGPSMQQSLQLQQPQAVQQQKQLQQQVVPLSSRLPPPLVPSKPSKLLTPQPNQTALQQQQQFGQRQQFGGVSNPLSATGMFVASQGFANLPAASSSSTGLIPASGAISGSIFSNHSITGSTPNLGSFANTKPAIGTAGISSNIASGYNNSSAAATHSVTNFGTFNMQGNQQPNQLMQQKQLTMLGNGQMQPNMNIANKYDLFKTVNPHAPSIFTGELQPQQQSQMLGGMSSQFPNTTSNSMMSSGPSMNNQQQSSGPRPTGIFAMANPTLNNPAFSQPQQQQQPQMNFQQNMFQNQNQILGAQQPHQQQQQQQQLFGMGQPGSAGGFSGQIQWR
ncbi:cytoskeletal protein binding protein [Coemansia spiralis]|uniref:Actin cytoskeleton-regulatory complex protein SLA1 n=2 Tax=Coemansia TaxID=4863 RepID=A0A9W8KXQ0_9FUNG|nr:cytoskeletal protein binding protein [Coemansia umbellata]KAJ2620974.1 cytoskeletal protein binding protein [Coemansia sp. RSA 1358]KAJ2675723.1 cytoskeletal protein binding protein [Coemansia spiralis]